MKMRMFAVICFWSVVFHAAEVKIQSRSVFFRNEKDAAVSVKITDILSGKTLTVTDPTGRSIKLTIHPGNIKIPVDTRLIPGKYQLHWQCGNDSGSLDYTIGPQYFTGFPVCIWGDGFASHRLYQKHGFTHGIRYRSTRYLLRTENKFYAADQKELDESLADGFIQGDTFDIGTARWGYAAELKSKYPRISRFGSKLKSNINILDPEARHAMENAALYLSKHPGSHPAYGIAIINSEVRDSTIPSFSKYDRDAYRKYSGTDIPELVNSKYAPYYTEIPGFPASRIVPDDYPLLKYYVWFWKYGDGWNDMNSCISRIFHKEIKHPVTTVFDPAVRCPPIWGNGGNVDVLQHWTYVNPDPIRVITTIDELRSMAAEKRQKVFGMGQLFVYREQAAPIAAEKSYPAGKFAAIKTERYITAPPDMLQELVWSMMFRQIQGMMFHGGASIFTMQRKSIYARTLPGTEKKFADLLTDQVKPLAPLVAALPDRLPQIAVFQSVASAIFAGRGSLGNESWPYVMYRIFQYAGYDPHMIFEEQLLRDGWGEIKVLLLPHCDVLTASALKKLQDFQRSGGIIIADEFLMPALMPDLRLNSGKLMNSKKYDLQRTGRSLARQLQKYFRPLTSSDNPDLITSSRSGGKANYIFVINDRRGFGDYLGIYGRIMEKGLPNSGKIWIDHPASAVYDCLTGKEVPAQISAEKTVIPVHFSTNDGKVFLLLDEKLGQVKISVPSSVLRGNELVYQVKILSVSGKQCHAVIPLKLVINYADGRTADIPEYAVTASKGALNGNFSVPLNAPAGKLTISVSTLPGKISGTAGVTIK